ncbi:MAG: glycosyltransferase family 4 protein [Eubacterium sp.]|nr:glycosyltransferase family 4 protein [Eubacterium sp.]
MNSSSLKEKRILFITHQLSYTGAPLVLLDVIKTYIKYGCRADVITMADGELKKELIKLGITPILKERFFHDREEFASSVSSYDLVWINTLVGYEAVYAMMLSDVKTIWWIHEGEQYFEYFKTVLPNMSRLTPNIKVISVSSYVQNAILKRYSAQTEILHAKIEDVPASPDIKKSEKVKFLTAGTMSTLKGQDILAMAIRLLEDGYMEKSEFYFCGNEDVYDENIKEAVDKLDSDFDNVFLLHRLSHEATLKQMEESDCLIVPSRVEPLSAVAGEMCMKCGVCIITDICGFATYIKDGKNGFTVPPENPALLAEKIRFVIDNRDSLKDIGKEARLVYENHFSPKVIDKRLIELFDI